MVSSIGECVTLSTPVVVAKAGDLTARPVEDWLSDLNDQMVQSLKDGLIACQKQMDIDT